MAVRTHLGVTKFTRVSGLDLAAQLLRHGLHAVTNTQNRHAQFKDRVGRFVVHLVHAGVAAGEDDALQLAVGRIFAHPVAGHVARMHLAIHMRLTHPTRDELGDLRAEIEDEDFLVGHET